MKKSFIIMAAALFLFCGGEDESGKCRDPGACNNCFKVYDSLGNYINGGSLLANSSYAQWNGRDCNGDSVPCGRYEIVYVVQGQSMTTYTIVAGPGAVVRDGSSACDSLRNACSGFFYEEDTFLGTTCVCCE